MTFSKSLIIVTSIFLVVLFIIPQSIISEPLDTFTDAQWARYGTNPVIQTGPSGSWDSLHIVVDCVLIVNGIYHLYYWGSSDGLIWNEGHAISSDGIHWVKDHNNPILTYARVFHALYENGLFKAWYTDTSTIPYCVRYAISTDGSIWEQGSISAVLSVTPDAWDSYVLMAGPVLHNSTGYSMWYSATSDQTTWSVGLAISQDGINWTKYSGNPVLSYNPSIEWRSIRVWALIVLQEQSELVMWFLGSNLQSQIIGVATSTDGKVWEASAQPVFDIGSPGSWDMASLSMSSVLQVGNTLWMWYSGTGAIYNYQIGLATTATVPTPPLEIKARAGVANTTLTWNPPQDDGGIPITQYLIFRGDTAGNEVFLANASSTNYVDTGLENGKTYYYVISARNILGSSLFSQEVSTRTPTIPNSPTWIIALPGNNLISMTWSIPEDGGDNITHYCLYRGQSVDSMTLLADVNGNSYTDVSVINGELFHYKVSAVNGVGESERSSILGISARTVPSLVTNLVALQGDGMAAISWNPPVDNGGSNVTGYRIYRGTISGSESLLVTINSTSFMDRNLTNGQFYYYKVSPLNAAGEGQQSIELKVMPSNPMDLLVIVSVMLVAIAIAAGLIIILFMTRRNRNGP